MSKEKAGYKAVRRAAAMVSSTATAKDKLDSIVRSTARALAAGVSLMLLDSDGKKLLHTSSWGLPQFYLRKGILDADRSLSEVASGKPVVIADVAGDRRIQYPEVARKAGIQSILGVPVISGEAVIGSLRVYKKEPHSFTNQDISFVSTMANLASVVLECRPKNHENEAGESPLGIARTVNFANPSEADFARILDFYNIEWVYEPRSFPLKWEGERITEMFTPDFYLPVLDLYVEVTTLKQSLSTKKNRKLSRLRKLYPEVKVMLLHKNEYNRLLARYGIGPLAQTRAIGINRALYTAAQIEETVAGIAEQISTDYAHKHPVLVGIQRGFLCFMADLIRQIDVPIDVDFLTVSYYGGTDRSSLRITKDLDLNITNRHVIVVEGVVDTGMTLMSVLNYLRSRNPASLAICTLLDKRVRRIADVPLKYVGFEIGEEFVVGYGLDYREEYRNLPFIGVPELGEARKNSDTKNSPKNSSSR